MFEPNFPDQLDAVITQKMRAFWHKSILFDASMMVIGQWTPIFMLSVIVVASSGWFLSPPEADIAVKSAFSAILSALLARVVNEPVARWAKRPRPFESEVGGALLDHEEGEAFPSNHATGAFALAMSFALVPGYYEVLLGMAILLAFARVYSGLHHATDVFAGVLHGTFVAWVLLQLLLYLHLV